MSMPALSRPAPSAGPGAARVRPGMPHGRAPSVQIGQRVPSGPAAFGARPVRPVRPGRPPMRPVRPSPGAPAAGSAAGPPGPTSPTRQPVSSPQSMSPSTSPRAAPRGMPRRRAYPSAHLAAHSVSYAGTPSDPSSVFTPAAGVGHAPMRSVSGQLTQSPVRPTGRAVSVGGPVMRPPATSVPPVPEVPAATAPAPGPGAPAAQVLEPSTITPAAVPTIMTTHTPGAAADAPGAAPMPGLVSQMGDMSVARVSNQPYNVVLGAAPPVLDDLDAPPPPIALPPNASLTTDPAANADPSYQRCTLNAVPTTSSLLTKSKLPLAVVLSPMRTLNEREGDGPVPVVSDSVIARCRRCRTYINPFVTFVEGGHRWRCCMCGITNEVPQLFDWDQETNQPADRWRRPELRSGIVEFIAPREYMVRPPQPPVYVFLLDVTRTAVASGMTATAALSILDLLDRLPNRDSRTRVAVIAFDAQLHFFRLVADSPDPSVLVVSDVNNVFLPQPNDLLVNLSECRAGLENLLRNFGTMYENAYMTQSALGAALQAAQKLIAACGGKIVVFNASLPSIGPGALKMREDPKLFGGPRESTLLTAASSFYKMFPIDCSRSQVSVDMWLFGPSYIDVASLACLPRYTGGQTYYYERFNAAQPEDVAKFSSELAAVLGSEISFEAVLRMRASRGLRATAFHGNFFVRSSDLLALPSVPRDQNYVIECDIDETITSSIVVFQSVVLHSTCYGERRIRVVTLALPTTTSLSEVYAGADQVAIATYFANKAVEKSLHSRLEDARGMLRARLADILHAYRSTMTNARGGNKAHLALSSNLAMLPLLILGLLRSPALRLSAHIRSDIRASNQALLTTLPPQRLVPFLLPVLYSLHNMPATAGTIDPTTQLLTMPPRLNLTSERFERHGLYLIEDGFTILLWVGRAAVPNLTMDVFGVPDYASLIAGKTTLPVLDNPMSRRVCAIVNRVSEQRRGPYKPTVVIIKEDGDPAARLHALSYLIEDKFENTSGYVQFLSQLRDKLNGV